LRVLAYLPSPTVLQSCQHVISMTWAAAGPASERNRGALHRLPTFTQYCKHETIARCLQAVSVSARLLSVLCFALAPSPVRCSCCLPLRYDAVEHAIRPAQAFTALACPSLSPCAAASAEGMQYAACVLHATKVYTGMASTSPISLRQQALSVRG